MKLRPSKRWFRFSLRTLFFAIAVGSVLLAWQIRIVHERRAAIFRVLAEGGHVGFHSPRKERQIYDTVAFKHDHYYPHWRSRLGDRAVATIITAKPVKREIRALFPEAMVGTDPTSGVKESAPTD